MCYVFLSLKLRNDEKAQKNGTKKTVYWVKKKPKKEDGLVKGEKWITSQKYLNINIVMWEIGKTIKKKDMGL